MVFANPYIGKLGRMNRKRRDTMEDRIQKSLAYNIEVMEARLRDCEDIVKRHFIIGEHSNIGIYMMFTDNLVNKTIIENSIMTNLMNRAKIDEIDQEGLLRKINEEAISIGEMKEITSFEELYTAVLMGDTVLLMDGNDYALVASTKGWPSRGVQSTETEVVVQGPKDAFTEAMNFNIVLVRRRIRDTRLKVKRSMLGRRSQTSVALMYMEDLVREEVLEQVKQALLEIDVDGILDSGYLEQLIEQDYKSPFPQMQLTERPDKAASAILEGRVVVIVDNTPFVILLPVTLNVFFQAAEDYYQRWEIMSLARIIRFLAAVIALVLPGLYIALTVYHPSMIPTALALKIAGARTSLPFPAVIEVLIMEIAFELLREAGIRLPAPVSSTIGIVGGIIIGQAAVEAGIVGPVVVIVSALTGICTFVIPNTSLVSGFRLSKYFILFMSSILGLYGFWLGILVLVVHLSSLSSFGIPYLYPFCSGAVTDYTDLKDSIIRLPVVFLRRRPIFTKPGARQRMQVRRKKGGVEE